jgi:hypothetical protein
MMKDFRDINQESGVSHLIEYIFVTSILLILMVIMVLSINPVFIERPVYQLTNNAFIDIGNGVSTRIVDLYIISPNEGEITTRFDIPDEVAGRGYFVLVSPGASPGNDVIVVSGSGIQSEAPLAGIGATLGVFGSTPSSGVNEIYYNSAGVG